ncbi:MAG TPA: BON domain-containing protein [Pyrinomonadaceae bacterium]|jgi:osmotically-inducible protein OsmY
MKKIALFSMSAVLAVASIGCSSDSHTNTNTNTNTRANANVTTTNTNANNTAYVVNTNNMETGTINSNANYNANITRAEYDKDKDRWSQEAKRTGGNIGSGVNDGWLWTKTRTALMTTNDLRDSTINVDVNNEIITLNGTVANAAQKAKAGEVANGIEGKKSVVNNLKVSASDSLTNQATSGGTTNTNANKR